MTTLKKEPKQFYEAIQVQNFEQVFHAPDISLSLIKKETGTEFLRSFLTLIISDVVEFFSVGKSMNEKQILQTSDLIAEEYYYFKPEDFKLCFNRAKKGRYGKQYDRLDGGVIFEWLQLYSQERSERAWEINTQSHEVLKKELAESRGTETNMMNLSETEREDARFEHYLEKSKLK